MKMVHYMTVTVVFILCYTWTNGATVSRHKRSLEQVDTLTYKACEANHTFCNGHGMCYQSIDSTKKKICRCDDDHYGSQCENEVNNLMETLVFGVAIFAGVMLIIVIIISVELCRRRRYYNKMRKQLLESTKMVEKPRTDMYTERKTSYACSIDEKFDLQPMDGYVKRNSFTPMDDDNVNDQVDVKASYGTSTQSQIDNKTIADKDAIAAEEEKEDTGNNSSYVRGDKSGGENTSVNSGSILDACNGDSGSGRSSSNSNGNEGQQTPGNERRGRSPTFNTDAVSVASEATSLPESERNLIPSPNHHPQQQQLHQRTLSAEQEAYEYYMAQRAAHQNQMMMVPSPPQSNGYMIPPHAAAMQGYKQNAPQMMPMMHPQQRSPHGLSTSPNNQVFFNTMQPRTNNVKNLHPEQARRKISAQSNASHGTRFGQPSPTHRYEAAKQQQRQRSPNRLNNIAVGDNLGQQQYNYTDSRGRPLSMTDLRILEEVSRNPGYDRRRTRSVEDLLTYDDGAMSEISMGSGATGYATGRKKRPGMWARSQART